MGHYLLDVAFSRDTDQKCMYNMIAEIVNNLINGLRIAVQSTFAVTKAKWLKMFKQLREVLMKEQNLSEEDAEEYLKQLKRDKRYQRDVLIERMGDTWLKQISKFQKNLVTILMRMEYLKADSDFLRGTIEQGLANPITGAISQDDAKLLKFHGSYAAR